MLFRNTRPRPQQESSWESKEMSKLLQKQLSFNPDEMLEKIGKCSSLEFLSILWEDRFDQVTGSISHRNAVTCLPSLNKRLSPQRRVLSAGILMVLFLVERLPASPPPLKDRVSTDHLLIFTHPCLLVCLRSGSLETHPETRFTLRFTWGCG